MSKLEAFNYRRSDKSKNPPVWINRHSATNNQRSSKCAAEGTVNLDQNMPTCIQTSLRLLRLWRYLVYPQVHFMTFLCSLAKCLSCPEDFAINHNGCCLVESSEGNTKDIWLLRHSFCAGLATLRF